MSSSSINFEKTNAPKQVQPSLTSPEMQMSGVMNDPNSIANISKNLQVLTAQTKADAQYDPPVPPPIEAFQDYKSNIFLIVLAIVLLILIVFIAMSPNVSVIRKMCRSCFAISRSRK